MPWGYQLEGGRPVPCHSRVAAFVVRGVEGFVVFDQWWLAYAIIIACVVGIGTMRRWGYTFCALLRSTAR